MEDQKKQPKQQVSRAEAPNCVHCKTRKARLHVVNYVPHLCVGCEPVVAADNLWKKLGLKKPTTATVGLMPSNNEAFVAEYVMLWEKGMRAKELAEHWGVSRLALHSKTARVRRAGFKVPGRETIDFATLELPPPPPNHGTGRWGKRDCTIGENGTECLWCKKKRSDMRKQLKLERRQQGEPS